MQRHSTILHDGLIQDQPNRGIDQTRHQQVANGIHLRNVMVLAKRLELRVKLVNTILVCLSRQLLHLIGKLHGIRKYKMQSGTARRELTRCRWTSWKRFSAAVFRSSLAPGIAGEFLPLPEGEALADSSSWTAPFATLRFFFLS